MERLFYLCAIAICYASAVPFDEGSNRIINGNLAVANQFPYAVSIQAVASATPAVATRGHRCGGVLITLQHVLTSATCLHNVDANGSTLINAADFRVFGGDVLLTNDNADRVRQIANFTVYPDYIGPPTYLHDLAIVTLTLPFTSVIVVPLPIPDESFSPPDFTLCTVAGWGATTATAATPSTELRYSSKYTYNHDVCTILFNQIPTYPNIMPTMMCAASFTTSTGCDGDNGNALVCNGTLTGILFLHGGCNTASTFPELYTRVNNYTTWIRSVTGSGPTFSPAVYTVVVLSVLQFITTKIVS